MSIRLADQELIHQVEQIAAQEQRTPEQVVAEAVRRYVAYPRKVPGVSFLLSIAGQGRSDTADVSQRDEEILAEEIDPLRGWHVETDDVGSA